MDMRQIKIGEGGPLFPEYKSFQIVTQFLGFDGWDLLAVIPVTDLIRVEEAIGVDNQCAAAGDGNYTPQHYPGSAPVGYRWHPGQGVRFLMGRKEGDVIGDYQEKLAKRIDELDALKKEKIELEEKKKALEEGIEDNERRRKELGEILGKESEDNQRLREKARKIEEDIGKLRKVFGEKAIREALADEGAE